MFSILLQAATAAFWGINYDPAYHQGWTTASNEQRQAWVQNDFNYIRSVGFTEVRTYFPSYYGFQILPYAKAANLRITLGVPIMDSTRQWTEIFINDAIEQARDPAVAGIIIGNENCQLPPTDSRFRDAVDETINWVVFVNARSSGKPVYTSQRYDWMLQQKDGRVKDLARVVAYLGVNLYPFYDSGCTCAGPSDFTFQMDAYLRALSGSVSTPFVVTETGWPSDGTGGQHPSNLGYAQSYYNSIRQWYLRGPPIGGLFYFQAFDLFDAPGPSCEQHFGILGKFPLSKNQTVSLGNQSRIDL